MTTVDHFAALFAKHRGVISWVDCPACGAEVLAPDCPDADDGVWDSTFWVCAAGHHGSFQVYGDDDVDGEGKVVAHECGDEDHTGCVAFWSDVEHGRHHGLTYCERDDLIELPQGALDPDGVTCPVCLHLLGEKPTKGSA